MKRVFLIIVISIVAVAFGVLSGVGMASLLDFKEEPPAATQAPVAPTVQLPNQGDSIAIEKQFATVSFSGGEFSSISARVGSHIVLPAADGTAQEQTLKGFATTPEGAVAYLPGGFMVVTGDVVLHPLYKDERLTITLYPSMQKILCKPGESVLLPKLNDSNKESFLGWSSIGDNQETAEFVTTGVFFQNTFLFPVYASRTYVWQFSNEDGVIHRAELDAGSEVKLAQLLPLSQFQKEGFRLTAFETGSKKVSLNEELFVEGDADFTVLYEAETYKVTISSAEQVFFEEERRYGETVLFPSSTEVVAALSMGKGETPLHFEDSDGVVYPLGSKLVVKNDVELELKTALQTVFTRVGNGPAAKITGPSYIELSFEGLDVQRLYTQGFSKYRMSLSFEATKIDGKCARAVAIYTAKPSVSSSLSEGSELSSKNSVVFVKNFDYGTVQTSSAMRETAELLQNNGRVFFATSAGKSSMLDWVNNAWQLSSVSITLEFYK